MKHCFLLDEEPAEVRVVPPAVPQVAVVSKDLNLITFDQLKDDGLREHALCPA